MHVVAVIPVRACVRGGGVAADDTVDHRFERHHLPATFARIVQIITPPPVPTATRVRRCGNGLRVQNDHVVRIGPAVVAGGLVEGGANRGFVLHAAVQRDVEFAGLTGGAAGGDVGVAGGGHAMGGGVAVAPERGLVEVDEAAGERADVLGVERAVEPVEDGAGGVEIAVVDVRAAIEGADAAEVVGGHGVFDGQVALVEDIRGEQVVGVHGAQVGHYGLPDDRVEGA